MPNRCCVPGCDTNSGHSKGYTSTFFFPKDPVKRAEWTKQLVELLSLEPSPSSVICIRHFGEQFIVREDVLTREDGSVLRAKRKRPKLTPDAVPTLLLSSSSCGVYDNKHFLIAPSPPSSSSSEFLQHYALSPPLSGIQESLSFEDESPPERRHRTMSSSSSSSPGAGGPTPAPGSTAQQQYCLKWNNHQTNLLRAFDRLLQSEAFTDVTLAAEGRSLRAHKVVLSACSSYFETLFEEHPDKAPIIILKDMKYAHVSQLVNFMYRGEINITQDMLAGLLKTAETLKVKGLAEVSGGGGGAADGLTPSQGALQQQSSFNAAAAAAAVASQQQQQHQQQQQQQQQQSAAAVHAAAAAHAAAAVSAASIAYRMGTSNSGAVPPSSVLTAALSGGQQNPASPPSLAPLAALLGPAAMDVDERRVNLLKRIANNNNNNNNDGPDLKSLEPLTKMARREPTESNHHHLLSSLGGHVGSNSSSPPLGHRPGGGLQQQLQQQQQQPQHFLHHASPPHRLQSPGTSLLHSSHFLNVNNNNNNNNSSSNSGVGRPPNASDQRGQQATKPSSPLQAGLAPLPKELTVNAQQDLPDFLRGFLVFKLNDYLGFRTRQQFWEEPAVRRIMEGIKNKEIDMKTAAELLGVSYGTLYGRYREVFGYLKHSWVNKGGRSSLAGGKEQRSIWDESRAQELIMSVLNKELSMTAAAVRLGVDTNTFFAHLTDNGKNKQRVAQLMGGHSSPSKPPAAAALGIQGLPQGALLAEQAANLLGEQAVSFLQKHQNNMEMLAAAGGGDLSLSDPPRTIDLLSPEESLGAVTNDGHSDHEDEDVMDDEEETLVDNLHHELASSDEPRDLSLDHHHHHHHQQRQHHHHQAMHENSIDQTSCDAMDQHHQDDSTSDQHDVQEHLNNGGVKEEELDIGEEELEEGGELTHEEEEAALAGGEEEEEEEEDDEEEEGGDMVQQSTEENEEHRHEEETAPVQEEESEKMLRSEAAVPETTDVTESPLTQTLAGQETTAN